MNKNYGTGYCPGTCGELVQGWADGNPFHITLPIELGSTTTIRHEISAQPLQIEGNIGEKTRLAIARSAKMVGVYTGKFHCSIDTELPIGKGMASSTADIASAVRAVCDLAGYAVADEEVVSVATGIESSDGTPISGIVAINQKTGQLHHQLSKLPELHIALLVPEGLIRTCDVKIGQQNAEGQARLLEDLKTMTTPSAADLGRLATASAIYNQMDNPNPFFKLVYSDLDQLDAVGIAVGHTGCVVGALFDTASACTRGLARLATLVTEECSSVDLIKTRLFKRQVQTAQRVKVA